MSEEIKEKNEIKDAGITEAEKTDEAAADAAETAEISETSAPAEPAAESDSIPAGPEVPETRLEWRDTLGLQLSDIEDYMVNAGENGGADDHADDHGDSAAPAESAAPQPAAAAVPIPVPEVTEAKKATKKGGFAKNLLSFIVGFGCCLAVLFAAARFGLLGRVLSDSDYLYYSGLDGSYGKFYEIMQMIGEDPIADKDPKDITDAELKEIVASIGDPYAEYYTAAEYEDMMKRFADDYVGIGIGVVEEDGKVVIKTIFKDTPAEEAGIQPEDVILEVDGKKPESVDDAVSMISGKAGTEVTVKIGRGDETLDFTIKRAKIETDSVSYGSLKDHPEIGYIMMSMFRQGTDKEFKDAVKALQDEGCSKFILDLRDNGGGLTNVCIEIADYLLPACKIMTENSKSGDETVYNSKADSAELELIVLVNENTASASEILTAALQDNGACKVIGTKTFGKGVIQIMHQFADGSGIKITTTEYFRPNGDPVNEVGITPDIDTGEEDALEAAIREFAQ